MEFSGAAPQHYFESDLYKLPPNNKVAKWGHGL